MEQAPKIPMEVLAVGDAETLNRPCVDCSLVTGCFCDWCYAVERDPDSRWVLGQHTPLCTACDRKYGRCHVGSPSSHQVGPEYHGLPAGCLFDSASSTLRTDGE